MIRETGKGSFVVFVLIAIASTGCNRNTLYTDTAVIPAETWSLDNIVEFTPRITDTSAICDIRFTIRTGTSYPFSNIWLFVSTTSPSGRSVGDTLQYMLADEKGEWYGRGFGKLRELALPYRTGIYFPETGNYTFRIRHGMRTGELKGVYDIGLRIEKNRK